MRLRLATATRKPECTLASVPRVCEDGWAAVVIEDENSVTVRTACDRGQARSAMLAMSTCLLETDLPDAARWRARGFVATRRIEALGAGAVGGDEKE